MTEEYRLILNDITAGESFLNRANPKGKEEYFRMAHLFLNHKGKHLFEEDILSKFRKGMTLKEVFEQSPKNYVQGSNSGGQL